MVVALQDTQVLAKIDGSDLIAKEVKYHLKCLISFFKKTDRKHKRTLVHESDNVQVYMNESRVFVELTNYMKTAVQSLGLFSLNWLIFILFISNDLVIFGITEKVNKTRLKLDLKCFPRVLGCSC